MSLRGTPAEAGGPKPFGLKLTAEKQSQKTWKAKRLPHSLKGVHPEVLEGLAMTKRVLEHRAFGPPARSASLSEGPDYLLISCGAVLGREEN